jgi:hypothetical protein
MDVLYAWLLSDPFGREKLALLVLCMVGIHILSSQLVWRISSTKSVGWGFVAVVRQSWFGRGMAHILRLFYYVGVPLVVLWRGALYREMGIATTYVGNWDLGLLLTGLGGSEEVLHLGLGAAIGGATLGALLVVWGWYARAVLGRLTSREVALVSAVPWWVALREALYLQLLWALYRGFAILLTGDLFRASYVSLVLIAVCWAFDPRRRSDLASSRGHLVVQDWLFALFTTFLALTVQSLWFLVVMHTLWIWFSGQVLAHFVRARVDQGTLRSSRV